jgi:acyl carrier protein
MDAVLLDVITSAIRSVAKRTQTVVITPDSLLVEDLALDSLDLVGVLMKVEDHYELTIELDEVANIRSVADLAAQVEILRGNPSAAA